MESTITDNSAEFSPRAQSAKPPKPNKAAHRLQGIRIPGWEGALFFLAIIALWQGITTWAHLPNPALFPSVPVILKALRSSLPELLLGTVSSFKILIPGYFIAVIAAIFWGLLVGTSGWLHRTFSPFARAVSPIPPTVYIPYAIALLPTFRISAIFVVFVGAFWPVFLNTAAGAGSVPARYHDSARILGLSHAAYLRRVVFPASLPHIFSGMGVGLAMAFILLTVAELFGANAGLGRFVQYYADFADYPRMAAGILYTGFVTLVSMGLLELVRRRSLFWVK